MTPPVTSVKQPTRYVRPTLSDGWLRVKLNNNQEISLPSFLMVSVYQEDAKRTYFVVMEGPNKGVRGSATRSSGEPNLVPGLVRGPAASVRFERAEQKIWFGQEGPFSAFSGAWRNFTSIAPGQYNLQIPDSPHAGSRYSAYSAYQKTWFRIMGNGLGEDSSRFLHLGELSDGCVTVRAFKYDADKTPLDPIFSDWRNAPPGDLGGFGLPYPSTAVSPMASWNNVYRYLIRSRLSDGFVGTLEVK